MVPRREIDVIAVLANPVGSGNQSRATSINELLYRSAAIFRISRSTGGCSLESITGFDTAITGDVTAKVKKGLYGGTKL
jgi:hypothetical protein